MRRADAMVRCALDLGLRSAEVARLSLDDIDWRAGTISLRGTKGRREDVMPLPASTGQAIAEYLRHERPKTKHRMVFARHIAPRERPIGAALVCMLAVVSQRTNLAARPRFDGWASVSEARFSAVGPVLDFT